MNNLTVLETTKHNFRSKSRINFGKGEYHRRKQKETEEKAIKVLKEAEDRGLTISEWSRKGNISRRWLYDFKKRQWKSSDRKRNFAQKIVLRDENDIKRYFWRPYAEQKKKIESYLSWFNSLTFWQKIQLINRSQDLVLHNGFPPEKRKKHKYVW